MKQIYNVTIDNDGSQYWRQNGKRHRIDGPAVINATGQYWYQNGKYHRVDGPAAIWANGDKEWWQNGKRHRIDGPAIIRANGDQAWWLNGKIVTEAEVMKSKPSCDGTEVVVDGVKYRLTAV